MAYLLRLFAKPRLALLIAFVLLAGYAALRVALGGWSDSPDAILQATGWFIALFLFVIKMSPRGILWWNSRLAGNTSVEARVSATFLPDDEHSADEVEEALRRWNGQRSFEVIRKADFAGGGSLDVLDVQAPRFGRVVVEQIRVPGDPGGDPDEPRPVQLLLPESTQSLIQLRRFVRGDLDELVNELAGLLGPPVGFRLDAKLNAESNPFVGVYVRDDVTRVGVTEFNVHLRPDSEGSRIRVNTTRLEIEAKRATAFRYLVDSFLGLSPMVTSESA